MITAPEWLKMQSFNLVCMLPGSQDMTREKNSAKGGVAKLHKYV